jgi:adenosyl cobinamide kinase/adenosyl cobinamide phosphate guanylyltransferase
MATPNRLEIVEKAKELWHTDRARMGDPSFNIDPEENELKEGGYLASAASELMYSSETKNAQWLEKNETLEVSKNESFDTILDVPALLRSGTVIFGGSGCGKSTLAKAVVRKLGEKGIVCYIVDPSRAWLDQGFEVVEVTKDQDSYRWIGQNTVFDVSRLTNNEKVIFVDLLSAELLHGHMNGVKQFEVAVLEEAELYIGNNSLRRKRLQNVLALLSNGRNFNLRAILISQVPSMVDKLPIKLTEQRVFGRLSEPNDQRYCKQLLGKEWVEQLKSLEVGTFLSENKGMVQRFKIEAKTEAKPKQFNFAWQFKSVSLDRKV